MDQNPIRIVLSAFLFTITSSILLYLGWPVVGLSPLLFIGFIPLFAAIDILSYLKTRWKVLLLMFLVFLGHFLWIGASLRWVHEASPKTYYIAITLESLSIAIASSPLFFVRKHFGKVAQWVFFTCAWLAVEYFNQQWMLGTPYFILGSGFGMHPEMIQVYEYIGIEGGSVLVLGINISLYLLINKIRSKQDFKPSLVLSAILLLPFVLSLLMSRTEESNSQKDKVSLAALHTDISTFTSYTHQYPQKIVNSLWDMGKNSNLEDVDLLVWPETVISNMGWLHNIANEKAYTSLSENLKNYPELSVCFGGYGYSLAKNGEDPYTRYEKQNNYYYNSHNVAITVNNTGRWPIRSKEIFIPFQERIPFLKQMPFLRDFADIVGANTMVSYYEYGDNVHRTSKGDRFVPVLCFESIYPLRMAESSEESDFMVILANEQWNKDLDGSHQYLYNNVGMAIQSRTPIVRSSNSGVSAIIDRFGNIVAKKSMDDVGVIKSTVTKKLDQTVYEMIAGSFYLVGTIGFFGLLLASAFRSMTGNKK
jgi:apolipoprotein N-acyltransferase